MIYLFINFILKKLLKKLKVEVEEEERKRKVIEETLRELHFRISKIEIPKCLSW